jgi:hypothetical protein
MDVERGGRGRRSIVNDDERGSDSIRIARSERRTNARERCESRGIATRRARGDGARRERVETYRARVGGAASVCADQSDGTESLLSSSAAERLMMTRTRDETARLAAWREARDPLHASRLSRGREKVSEASEARLYRARVVVVGGRVPRARASSPANGRTNDRSMDRDDDATPRAAGASAATRRDDAPTRAKKTADEDDERRREKDRKDDPAMKTSSSPRPPPAPRDIEDLGDVRGRVHSVDSFTAVDGHGIRAIVFLQGCEKRCVFCCNPDSWSARSGASTTAKQVFARIQRNARYYAASGGGITLSGGEPLLQARRRRRRVSSVPSVPSRASHEPYPPLRLPASSLNPKSYPKP